MASVFFQEDLKSPPYWIGTSVYQKKHALRIFVISMNIGVLSDSLLSNEDEIKTVMLLIEAFVGHVA